MNHVRPSVRRNPIYQALRVRWLSITTLDETASYILIGLILTVGLVLRLWTINALGYNSDETVYAGQAASIAGVPVIKEMFPIFRAHPLIFPFLLSLGFRMVFNDLLGRLLVVAFGIATIYLTYHLGTLLYNRRIGLLAALMLALMPYHIIVTRQVLLDGPMVCFAILALYLVTRFAVTQHSPWLWAAGAAMGLTFLTKETGIVLMGGIYVFLALSPSIQVRIRDLIISIACMGLVILPHPIAISLAGTSKTAGQYLLWQVFRRPNHTWDFYPTTVPTAIGPLVIIVALLGLWLLWRQRSWRETLLIGWIATPVIFFQLWPVKGFQYLLPIAPVVAILAARMVFSWSPERASARLREIWQGWGRGLLATLLILSLLIPGWVAVQSTGTDSFIAGAGGIAGGRETGLWIRDNVPQSAKFITIGPSMANIIQFYGRRRSYGLSVSTNPLHRNPVYVPIENPDRVIRSGEIQYIVYDTFSAGRSPAFAELLMKYVRRFQGHVVHTESITVTNADGSTMSKPVIVIYEVRP